MTGHCPAMKIRCRQVADGWQMTFLIPLDAAPAELVLSPEGTKYMLAYAPYSEAERAPQIGPDSPARRDGAPAPAPILPQQGQVAGAPS